MKKVIIGLLFVFLLTGCMRLRTENVIEDLNENSNFEYDLLTNVTDDIKLNFSIEYGFGVYTLIDPSIYNEEVYGSAYINDYETTTYDVTAYPDYSDGGAFITRILTSDPNINIYDISVGDYYLKDDLTSFLTEKGFELDQYNSYNSDTVNHMYISYQKERLEIRFRLEDHVITQITVLVEITNKEGIIF